MCHLVSFVFRVGFHLPEENMTNRELAEIIYNLTIEIQKSIKVLKEWQEEEEIKSSFD